jgi:alkanesulfonate monooxygenase
MGEVWPPMLARAIATVDHIAQGRLSINVISSDMPGSKEHNETRYRRSSEIIEILKQSWSTEGPLEWKGEFYTFSLPTTEPAKLISKTEDHCYISVESRPRHKIYAQSTVTCS